MVDEVVDAMYRIDYITLGYGVDVFCKNILGSFKNKIRIIIIIINNLHYNMAEAYILVGGYSL